MKLARFVSWIFGILGTVLMAFSIGLCLISLNKEAKICQVPDGAQQCIQQLSEAVNAGDYQAISQLLYGQPALGAEQKPADTNSVILWDAFVDSLACEVTGECVVTQNGLGWSVSVSAMDVPSVTAGLSRRAHDLMTEKVHSATDMTQLYDENNEFREELVEDVLQDALVRALAEDGEVITREITLELICRDGKWWVLPNTELLTLLSGSLA